MHVASTTLHLLIAFRESLGETRSLRDVHEAFAHGAQRLHVPGLRAKDNADLSRRATKP
jgi:hypothetical protein